MKQANVIRSIFAAVAVAVIGRVAPEWIDSLLYSAEELEVLYPEL